VKSKEAGKGAKILPSKGKIMFKQAQIFIVSTSIDDLDEGGTIISESSDRDNELE
jgi:hypothetical protein